MRNSWVDFDGAWLSFHAGQANVNHSHLDTGSFVVDLLGERWAFDLGGDDYNMDATLVTTSTSTTGFVRRVITSMLSTRASTKDKTSTRSVR